MPRPPQGPPKLIVRGYDLEIRQRKGWWYHYEGRIIRTLSYEGSDAVHRDHWLPNHGPGSNGKMWWTTSPYWMRGHDREYLTVRLVKLLNRTLEKMAMDQPSVTPLEDTMAGWQ